METNVAESPVVKTTGDKVLYLPKNKEVRIGSRQVRIERIPDKRSMLPKEKNASFFRNETIKRIGSEWKTGTRDCIRGLNGEEEQIYLPRLIGSKPDHPDWEKAVKNYWWDYGIDVPHSETPGEGGVLLEIGFKMENGKPVPINIKDYIDYNFAKESKLVAPEGDDNPLVYVFRLIDLGQEEEKEEAVFLIRKQADRAYLKLLKDAFETKLQEAQATVDNILETTGGEKGKGISIYGMSDVKKQLALEKVKDRDFAGFLKLVEDPTLGLKALIAKGVTFQRIIKEGETYFYNSKMMGRSLKDAVLWLQDLNNSEDRTILTEALSQYTK